MIRFKRGAGRFADFDGHRLPPLRQSPGLGAEDLGDGPRLATCRAPGRFAAVDLANGSIPVGHDRGQLRRQDLGIAEHDGIARAASANVLSASSCRCRRAPSGCCSSLRASATCDTVTRENRVAQPPKYDQYDRRRRSRRLL